MTSVFRQRLRASNPSPDNRRWLAVPYDQLHDGFGELARSAPEDVGIVMVETPWKGNRRPYHKQKLALILANMRQFALEQAARGVAVRYIHHQGSYREALAEASQELGPLAMMRPAERELRRDLGPLLEAGHLRWTPHEGWLTEASQFLASQKKGPPWRMDAFYRKVRQDTGILMEGGKPVGGKYSFDADNRKRWDGEPAAPDIPRFEVDEVDDEVGQLIEAHFGHHPGRLDLETLATTAEDAQAAWLWAKSECMVHFGPFEDAMSTMSRNLFHSRISHLINIHRLLPRQVLDEVLTLDVDHASKEGYVRQLIGWREFMRHVHEQTDGLRQIPGWASQPECASDPGDGGWSRAYDEPWPQSTQPEELDGGSVPSFLGADQPLPAAFWGQAPSGLRCLDHVVDALWEDGYTHHIERLMILSNIATLLEISPRELTDWFWCAYIDAYDWVVEPNVLGMGTFALGPLFVTKPYVSGANYIHKMSDFCGDCSFHPKKTCPVTRLFWAFMARHRERLDDNFRMKMMLRNVDRRSDDTRHEDARVFERCHQLLARGEAITPDSLSQNDDQE